MSNILWQKKFYKADIPYLIDVPIRAFDITKANINVLLDAGVLSKDQHQYLLNCPKLEREVFIGKLQGSDKRISEILADGIADARRVFMAANNLYDSDILEIRNDSLMVIGRKPITVLDITENVKFRDDGKYTSCYRLNLGRGPIDLYYYGNIVEQVEYLHVKGLGEAEILHREYMLDFIQMLSYSIQFEGAKSALSILSKVHDDYTHLRMNIGYYREMDAQSKYRLNPISKYADFLADYLTNGDKFRLDITYNEAIFRYFGQILSSIYFGRM